VLLETSISSANSLTAFLHRTGASNGDRGGAQRYVGYVRAQVTTT
jgi:hypothetical protein